MRSTAYTSPFVAHRFSLIGCPRAGLPSAMQNPRADRQTRARSQVAGTHRRVPGTQAPAANAPRESLVAFIDMSPSREVTGASCKRRLNMEPSAILTPHVELAIANVGLLVEQQNRSV